MADPIARLQAAFADRYVIDRELGRGSTARVYLARDLKHDRPVVLKMMRPELAATIGAQRFLREIQVASRLQHPHLVPLYDSGEVQGSLFFVMPYVDGESLRTTMTRLGKVPLDLAIRVAGEVALALDYAHRQGVVHRDIKPENIIIEDGRAVVADFGIARALNAAAGDRITEAGVTLGTPVYMSPEQASGERLDGRSDIYSLSIVLFEMLAGEPPFTGKNPQAIIARRFTGTVPPVRPLRREVPEWLERVVQKAMQPVPADRFQTAREFAEALGMVGADTPARPGAVVDGRRSLNNAIAAYNTPVNAWWALAAIAVGALLGVAGWVLLVK